MFFKQLQWKQLNIIVNMNNIFSVVKNMSYCRINGPAYTQYYDVIYGRCHFYITWFAAIEVLTVVN